MNLHVESEGEGEPVLFLHGVSGSAATYRWLVPEGFRAVRLTFRGHGASARAPGTYRLADYAEDAVSVLEEIGPAAVVGHSLGGVVAWTVAQQRPELVTQLFMEDPPLFMGEPDEHAQNPAIPHFHEQQAAVRTWQAAGTSEAQIEADLAAEYGTVQTPEALASRAYALRHLDPEVLDRVLDGSTLAATDTRSPVSVPTLVVGADVAPAFPPAHEARLAATHPDVPVVRIAGAPHTIHDTAAVRDQYVAQLLAFLT
ncbi:alpha/beta hydrolase [Solirubrobacter phytolaccae]|uniref:Alpha/beta hydrolase n=1 Tax=Solirubrobacter phytolaccae TaxID=1404360 RepID=A0A9X3NET6_9ACTN|nr:alpha/beta hydrolase [Solirubrobacter phytolaccae]MDA0184829.1 alpha/beta hydrolase [Solirubrobacter phytolaccae]